MKVESTITLSYENEKKAKTIQQALTIDDQEFVSSTVKNNIIHATIKSRSLPSFIQTIDDYLSCVVVAESVGHTNTTKKNK